MEAEGRRSLPSLPPSLAQHAHGSLSSSGVRRPRQSPFPLQQSSPRTQTVSVVCLPLIYSVNGFCTFYGMFENGAEVPLNVSVVKRDSQRNPARSVRKANCGS